MGRTTGLLVLLSLASQALSLGIQVALAHRFGAGTEVDAYVAALTLPGLMEVFLLAAVSQLLLPALVRRIDRGERQEAWRALATLVTVLGGGCLLLSIPVALSGPAIIRLTAPGLEPATRALAGGYLTGLFPGLALGVTSALLTQAFHAERRFLWPAAAGMASQVIPLAAVVFLGDRLGLWSLVLGTLAARLAVIAPLAVGLARRGVPLRPRLDLAHPDVRRMAWLAVPAMVAVASARTNGAIDRFFVSFLGPGKLAVFGYADRVVSLVLAVLVSPVTAVLYPMLAGLEARGDRAGLFRAIDAGLRGVIAGMIPVAVALAVLAAPAITVVFQHGRFSAADTAQVAGVIGCYAGIVVLGGVGSLLTRGFYAVGNTRDPMIWGGLLPVAFNIAMDAAVYRTFGVYGVAAVTSLNALLGLPLLYIVLRRRLGAPVVPGWGSFLLRALAAGAGMAAVTRMAAAALPFEGDVLAGIGSLVIAGVAGLSAYAIAALALRIEPAVDACARIVAALRARGLFPSGALR